MQPGVPPLLFLEILKLPVTWISFIRRCAKVYFMTIINRRGSGEGYSDYPYSHP